MTSQIIPPPSAASIRSLLAAELLNAIAVEVTEAVRGSRCAWPVGTRARVLKLCKVAGAVRPLAGVKADGADLGAIREARFQCAPVADPGTDLP